jgi:two-component system chemotaxis response regulator CheY
MEVNRSIPAEAAASAKTRCEMDPPQHILLVDDESSIQRLAVEALTRAGYNVNGAEDGAAAWQALNADRYDLLITDNNMPNMTGVELLKALRAARMDLPVIMATGALPMLELMRHPQLQPAAALIKPYSPAELLGAVKMVLNEPDQPADGARLSASCEMKQEKMSRAGKPTRVLRPRPTNWSHRILAVDEDRDLRSLYIEALTRPGGYRVDVAEDGAAGWAALQAHNYHLLITEHEIPRLSGVDLVRKLRAAHMALPVVLAAGRLPTDKLARNPSLQLAAMLEKPFAVDTLLDTVNAILCTMDSTRAQIDPQPGWQTRPSANALRL